jgi:hypothetical protein
MSGYNTLWVPGVDHAGIATQVMLQKFQKTLIAYSGKADVAILVDNGNVLLRFFLDQVVVEKKIMKEGNKTRHDLGREQFVAEVLGYFLFIYSDHPFSLLVSIFQYGFPLSFFCCKAEHCKFYTWIQKWRINQMLVVDHYRCTNGRSNLEAPFAISFAALACP